MKIFVLLFLLVPTWCEAQSLEILWTDSFRKEVQMTCEPQEFLCEDICGSASACVVEEGFCLSCIGTSMQMFHLFSEIGRSIRATGPIVQRAVADLIIGGDFVTFTARDAYNIIDAYNSLAVLKKFESLCPDGSLNQILFFRVHHETRKLLSPEFLYCALPEGAQFFKVQDKILIERGRLIRAIRPF